MKQFMDEHPDAGIAGCKLLNTDGTLQPACRRGFPSPWVAFTKIFGLQALFPQSRLFGQYNQTFRSEDEEAEVDAISGAFMVIRREVIQQTKGFDPDFFMYGEDLDLCYRCKQAGWKVYYTPIASVVHFKGESTRRSTINEVKVFYEAMEIFTRKHFYSNKFLLLLLHIGIKLRATLAYLNRYKFTVILVLIDSIALNFSLAFSAYIRFGNILGLPEAAYPLVHIVLTVVVLSTMAASGAYNRFGGTSLQSSLSGMTLSFFLASALTYYFKQYAYSRGVLLMTVGFTIAITVGIRFSIGIWSKIRRATAEKRLAIVTVGNEAEEFFGELSNSGYSQNIQFIGTIIADEEHPPETQKPILGNISRLNAIAHEHHLSEIIVLGAAARLPNTLQALKNVASGAVSQVYIVHSADELLASKVIGEVSSQVPHLPEYKVELFRYRVIKRTFDIFFSFFSLLLLPIFVIFGKSAKKTWFYSKQLLFGKKTLIGMYPVESSQTLPVRIGFLGLAHSSSDVLSDKAIEKLNEYYARHYSLTLDFEILVKSSVQTIGRLFNK
jgi:hypothetical protein